MDDLMSQAMSNHIKTMSKPYQNHIKPYQSHIKPYQTIINDTLTYCSFGPFGGRPQHFSCLSVYFNADGKIVFPDQPVAFFAISLYYLIYLYSSLLHLRPPRNECTNQVPIATVSTYHKDSRRAGNPLCTEQQSTYCSSTFLSGRQQRATTQAGKKVQQVFGREPPCIV